MRMADKKYEMIIEPSRPIPLSELETMISDGEGLNFPLSRSYEFNLTNSYWNSFVSRMTEARKDDFKAALDSGNTAKLQKIVENISGISSMYRLNSAALSGNKLSLEVGVTDFKSYICTCGQAIDNPEFRRLLIDAGLNDYSDMNHYFANPLATCANIVTSDGYMPLGMRSKKVATYPDCLSVIGGFVKVNGNNKPDFTSRDVDFFTNMRQELTEELGLEAKDLNDVEFIGIHRTSATRHPEIQYNVPINMTKDELLESWRTKAEDKFEHRNISFYKTSELGNVIDRFGDRITPTGEAVLRSYMRLYDQF